MSWFSRISRFASVHMVRSQDKSNGCAMSSIAMVNFKMKKGLMFSGMAAGASLSVSPIPGASYLGQTLARAAIDYAIAHKLVRVEAGAQGEHKLARGYRPVITRSAHLLADPGLARAVAAYLPGERREIAAAKAPAFKPGAALKKAVTGA